MEQETPSFSKRLLCKILLDILVLAVIGLPYLVLHFAVSPSPRGFHCNDASITYPYHPDTVSFSLCVALGFLLTWLPIIAVELLRWSFLTDGKWKCATVREPLMTVLAHIYKFIGVMCLGALINQTFTDIGKYTIGRLRPHFLEVCQPSNINSLCTKNNIPTFQYVPRSNFSCTSGTKYSAKVLKDAFLSFPSGHSSFSFFCATYAAFYLQARLRPRGLVWTLRPFLQILVFAYAYFVACSRISDFKHHWSDVLAGSLIGTISAICTCYFVSKKVFFSVIPAGVAANGTSSSRRLSLQRPDTEMSDDLGEWDKPRRPSQHRYRPNDHPI